MNKKYPWLPLDERLIPDIFSFKYPRNPWVRWALFVEITCAVIAVVGTLLLTLMPRRAIDNLDLYTSESTTSTNR